jgi:hypothetical protein
MPQFRKKPVVINAVLFDWKDGEGIPDISGVKYEKWSMVKVGHDMSKNAPHVETAYIETLEGKLHVSRGDWIITGVQGERYPCKPDIFAATYEPV